MITNPPSKGELGRTGGGIMVAKTVHQAKVGDHDGFCQNKHDQQFLIRVLRDCVQSHVSTGINSLNSCPLPCLLGLAQPDI